MALILLWPSWPLAGIAVLALSHALILYPTLRPNVQWLGPVVTRFATQEKELWLTIDDGPEDDTPAVLDLLDRRAIKATFFVKGVLAERHADLAGEILRRGHSLANHSHTHPSASWWCLPPGRIAAEIDGCNRALRSLTGEPPRWFRAPVGFKNFFVHPALTRRNMRLIGWTARGFDAVRSDGAEVLSAIVPHLRPGAIVLLHQGHPYSLRVLEHVIVSVQAMGYAFVVPRDEQLRAG